MLQNYMFIENMVNILCGNQADASLDPIYQAITLIGPWALSIITVCGLIYGVIIGTKFSKAEDSGERQKLQKALINGVIGFIAILVLVAVLYGIREPLVEFMNS